MNKKKLFIAGGILAATSAAGIVIAKKSKSEGKSIPDAATATLAKALNPISAEPATPLETAGYLESLTPSLMTRGSLQQGAVTGFSVLGAKGISTATEAVTNALLIGDKSYANKLFTRGALAIGGHALSKLPDKNDESLVVSSARSAGRLLEVASISGMVYDSVTVISEKRNKRSQIVPITLGALLSTGLIYRGKNMLEERRGLIETIPQDPSNQIIPATISAVAVVQLLKLLGFGMKTTGNGLQRWLGEGPLKTNVAKFVNVGLWSSMLVGAYWGGVAKIGSANEKIEPSYSTPPSDPNVSGSPTSNVTFEQIGQQGRKFVSNVVKPVSIQKVTGKIPLDKPVRVYIGFDTPQNYRSQRTEMAIAELKRTKAFDRKYLLLISPTGTGWIDHTSVESAELYSRGDIASCVVQYAKYPSFLALQKVHDGRRQFRELLWAVKLITDDMPKAKRPKVVVFGLSLGSWSSSDAVMHTGIDGFDHYGIDRALWAGMPGLAKWGKIEHRETKLKIPKGSMQIFDRQEQYEKLSATQRNKLRAIILNHDDDPIALIRPKLIVKRPGWLKKGNRGRGVPKTMEWSPFFTFIQVAIDAANAMTVVPGHFRSHGHDYRGDMAYFVNEAYQFGASPAVVKKANDHLVELEVERAKKSKALSANTQ